MDEPDLALKSEGLRERPEAEITTKTEVGGGGRGRVAREGHRNACGGWRGRQRACGG